MKLKEKQEKRVAEIMAQVRGAVEGGRKGSIGFKSAPSRTVRRAVQDQARKNGYRIAFNVNGRSMIVFGKRSTSLDS